MQTKKKNKIKKSIMSEKCQHLPGGRCLNCKLNENYKPPKVEEKKYDPKKLVEYKPKLTPYLQMFFSK